MRNWDYYFITDSSLTGQGIMADVEAALEAGCRVVQYREKGKASREMLGEAVALKRLCRGKADFVVNDRLDIFLASGADGIHLGDEDLQIDVVKRLAPGAIIGATVHNGLEAKAAEEAGASYVGASPVFATSTKKDAGEPRGLAMLAEVKAGTSLPIVAIGGINMENVASVISAGADSAAMISAVVGKPSVRAEVAKARKLILEARRAME